MDDVQVLRDAARRCYPRLREARSVAERRALLRLMVVLWDRADELERRRSSGVSPAANDGMAQPVAGRADHPARPDAID